MHQAFTQEREIFKRIFTEGACAATVFIFRLLWRLGDAAKRACPASEDDYPPGLGLANWLISFCKRFWLWLAN